MTTTVLATARFGEVTFDESQVLQLAGGLVGIPGTDRVLVMQPGGEGPLYWLQSAERGDVAVVVADLAQVAPDYRPVIPPADLTELGLAEPSAAILLGVCVLAHDPAQSTVNLRAPLVVNPIARRGRQVLLDDERYAIRHPLVLAPAPALAAEA